MKPFKIVRAALFFALAVCVSVFAKPLTEHLRYFIGAFIIFCGVDEIIFTAVTHPKHYEFKYLFWNIAEIIIGLTLLILVKGKSEEVTYAVVCTCWAIWCILGETTEIVDCAREIKKRRSAIPNIVESLTVIALSVFLIYSPTAHHATIHLYVLTAEIVTWILFPLLDYRKPKREQPIQAPIAEEAAPGESAPPEETDEAAEKNAIQDEERLP